VGVRRITSTGPTTPPTLKRGTAAAFYVRLTLPTEHGGHDGKSHLAGAQSARPPLRDAPLEEAPLYREETLTIIQALADLVVDVKVIRQLLEEDDEEEEEEEP
jgi:hypothetical protein